MSDGPVNGPKDGPVAVVLFNLGGPDRPAAVLPFLTNLFSDPAIIPLPGPIRWLVARVIAKRRGTEARKIYDRLGGGSPLLENTKAQADALEAALNGNGDGDGGGRYRVVIAMRYWHPFAAETAAEVAALAPTRVVLLPLYPQFSTTTTGSSLTDWRKAAKAAGLRVPTTAVCCYPTLSGLAATVADQIRAARDALAEQVGAGKIRILFSAHGLPKSVVKGGDPYQWQVEQTTASVVAALGVPDLDWTICYQSRVGPMEWIGPSTEEEIARAAADRVGIVVVPIAFVSEHSETLVELDVEYREQAAAAGVPAFARVPTVSTRPEFIRGLADVVNAALARDDAGVSEAPAPADGRRLCPQDWKKCPCRASA